MKNTLLLLATLGSLLPTPLSAQSLTNIHNVLAFGNPYGDKVLEHIDDLSTSVFEITGLEAEGEYLEVDRILELAEPMDKDTLSKFFGKLNFPLAIHVCEAYRKFIGGDWKLIKEDRLWIPYVIKGESIYDHQSIYDSWLRGFEPKVERLDFGKTKVETNSLTKVEVVSRLSKELNIENTKLNYTVKSLQYIDATLDLNWEMYDSERLRDLVQLYVGEVFIQKHGGIWQIEDTGHRQERFIKTEAGKMYPVTKVVEDAIFDDEQGMYFSGFYVYYLVGVVEMKK